MVVGHSEQRVRFGKKLAGLIGICGVAAAIVTLGAVSPAHAVPVPERVLAGIKIFSPSDAVLKKFGTPDEVRIGDQSSALLTDGAIDIGGGAASTSGSTAGGPGGPGAGGYPGSAPGGAPGGYPGAGGGGYPGGAGGYPGQRPGGAPGGYPGQRPGGAPGGYPGGMNQSNPNGRPGAGATGTPAADSTVTWVYDRPDGTSLEFTLSSGGRVIQIHLSGYKSVYKTARGIALGMSLATVNVKYGFPESQNINGRVLNMNYIQKFHAAFQFLNQKLVGIIVAAVD